MTPPPSPESISFITCGPFSGANASVLPRLAAEFPDLEPTEFDVALWLHGNLRLRIEAGFAVVAEAGPRSLRGRDALGAALWRSDFLFRRVSREARRRTAPGRIAFSLQTQSLIDASVDGLPHFVYTDHTGLANSYYPDHKQSDLDPSRLKRERQIYENARLVFTMSSHVSRSLVEHYGIDPERISCVYAGSNVKPLPRRADAPESKQVLFVGRDWKRKGGPELVAAMREVRETCPEAKLVVAGCFPEGVPEWVEILGDVPFHRIAELFAETAIFAMPTRAEPFGLVYVEALSCGVPVVATDIGALPDIVGDCETGLLVKPDDLRGLAAAIIALLDDPARARRFGVLGAQRMSDRYTWSHVASSMASQIREELGHSA